MAFAWPLFVAALLSAPESVRVSLFSIFAPAELSLEASDQRPVAFELRGVDGATARLEVLRVSIRCRRGVLSLESGGQRQNAASLATGPLSSVRLAIPGQQAPRAYAGRVEVRAEGDRCQIVNTVPFERYVELVTCQEIRGAPPEALRAQAILVRTFALRNLGRHEKNGADVCDLTHCQVYQGEEACTPAQIRELGAVRGRVLLAGDALAEVAFSSTCGGHTAGARDVWGPGSDRPYLRGVPDGEPPHCAKSPHFRWRFEVPRAKLCEVVLAARPALGQGGCDLEITSTTPGGWVREVRVLGAGPLGEEVRMSGEQFHLLLGRALGWSAVKSAAFVLARERERFVFVGRGLGHGVGLCQHGAMGLAGRGESALSILQHYFPGTRLGSAP